MMPGKTNPTQAEALAMVCVEVLGNGTAVTLAASQGSLQLNVYKPLIAHNVLRSIGLLADATRSFERLCLRGLEPHVETLEAMVERSLMLVTALSPHIGYDAAARIAERAQREGLSLREAALASGLIDETRYDAWVRPERMLGPEPRDEESDR
jgi:fumarate hydratase class II